MPEWLNTANSCLHKIVKAQLSQMKVSHKSVYLHFLFSVLFLTAALSSLFFLLLEFLVLSNPAHDPKSDVFTVRYLPLVEFYTSDIFSL